MTELDVTSIAAVSEPRTAATTTTALARFLDGAAFRTYSADDDSHNCWSDMQAGRQNKRENRNTTHSLLDLSEDLSMRPQP